MTKHKWSVDNYSTEKYFSQVYNYYYENIGDESAITKPVTSRDSNLMEKPWDRNCPTENIGNESIITEWKSSKKWVQTEFQNDYLFFQTRRQFEIEKCMVTNWLLQNKIT